jgi:hypothetical protein
MTNDTRPSDEYTLKPISRRSLLQGVSAATVSGIVGSGSFSPNAYRANEFPVISE